MKKVAIITIVLTLIAGIILYLYYSNRDKPNNINRVFSVAPGNPTQGSKQNPLAEILDISTTAPFEELTIPYLRNRKYTSSLGELKKVSENANYTSYLTSYDSEDFTVNGLLTRPKSAEPESGFPAVVFIHGYIPPESYNTLTNYSAYVDYIARNGFVVFKIDLRGHDDSEGEAGGGYYSADYIIDTLNAYTALQNTDFIDAKKIGLWGHSMAGNVVLRAVAAKQNIPAVVIWAGAGFTYDDLQQLGIDDNSYRPPRPDTERQRKREQLFATHGRYSATSEFWKKVVPTNFLDGVTTAIQLNHAVNDNVVNIGYSRNLTSILDKTAIVHELKEQQGGGHNITGTYFNQAMRNTVQFFKENL